MTDLTTTNGMIWHNSALNTFAQCEQKFTYAYLRQLKRPETEASVPLLRGSWFHALMAAQGWMQGVKQGTLVHQPDTIDLGFEGLHDVAVDWDTHPQGPVIQRKNGNYFLSPDAVHTLILDSVFDFMPKGLDEEMDNLDEEVWLLYQRYVHRWGHSIAADDVLAVELQWQRTEPQSGITLGGRADRLVRTPDGRVTLRDHKTTSQSPTADVRLSQSQAHLYAWGLAEWLDEHDVGQVEAIEYDYAITRTPGSVRLTKAGNLYKNQATMDEYAFCVGLADLGEDPDDEKWAEAREEMREVGDPKFFHRERVPVSEAVVVNLLDALESADSRAQALSNGAEPVRSTTLMCQWCEFSDVCTAELYDNDASVLLDGFTEREIERVP